MQTINNTEYETQKHLKKQNNMAFKKKMLRRFLDFLCVSIFQFILYQSLDKIHTFCISEDLNYSP